MIQRWTRVRTLLFTFLLFAAPLLACEFSVSSATITNAVMAKDARGDNFDPVGVTDAYAFDQSKFHAIVTVSNAPGDTAVKAVWTAVDVGSVAAPNTRIDQAEIKIQGSRNVDFTLAPDGEHWPPGTYKVDIYLNDKLDRSLNFTVAAPPPTPTPSPRPPTSTPIPATRAPTAPATTSAPPATSSAPQTCPALPPAAVTPSGVISKVTMALDAQGANKDPVNPTTLFPPNATFHAVVATQNAPANTVFTADWFATDIGAPDCNIEIDSTDLTTDGTRNIDFTLKPKTVWPNGTYRVEISVNGVLDRVVSFTVGGNAPSNPPTPTTARPAAPVATATRPPSACGSIPAGKGAVVFKSSYGQEILVDVPGKLVHVPPNGTSEPAYLPPGKQNYHAKINQVAEGNGTLDIQEGMCLTFTFSP